MTRHQHTESTVRRWTMPALFAGIAIATVAGCTSAAATANDAASAVSPHATTMSHGPTANSTDGADQSSAALTADAATTSALSPTRKAGPDASTPARSTAAPRTTAAPAGRTTTTAAPRPTGAAAAPTTTTAAPDTPPAATTTSRGRVTSSARPPTTPVAPPVRGNINQTVPAESQATLPAAPLTEPAQPHKGVVVEVSDIRAISTEARFPGEIAGPGIAVTIHIVNSSAVAIDLDNSIVDVRGSDGTRGIAVSGTPANPMSGSLSPGQQTSGVYVFTLPQDQRSPISIRFSYAAETPTVLFVGDAQ